MRESGILMHVTCLPGRYGMGTMGKQAYQFLDFLENAGQHCWQVLPLNLTGYGDSPYQCCSSFAGNDCLIDPDLLAEAGLLKPEELTGLDGDPGRVDFGKVRAHRQALLHLAYSRFRDDGELEDFCRTNDFWLADLALYLALKDENGGKPWYAWDGDLKARAPEAMEQAKRRLAEPVRYYSFVQYLFYSQWDRLHRYAGEKKIRIIGDVPIYVPLDSCDVWKDPELFQLDENGDPVAVAGCPPDGFTADGQLWGNPLYRWDAHKKQNYAWWIRRLAAAGRMVDAVRIDHFRGLESYWSIPYGDTTARNGRWEKGPGMDLIRAIRQALPQLELIAEDLGLLTPEVLKLRDQSGCPGMKVLQFAFDSPEDPSDYLPHNHVPDSVCYTGTHDNMTTRQWLESLSPASREYAVSYMGLTQQEGLTWGVIRTAMASVSRLCVIPMQDYLDLGSEGRMNFPGTTSPDNWSWRALPGAFSPELARRIRKLTVLYCR